jgi:hypothetical protein
MDTYTADGDYVLRSVPMPHRLALPKILRVCETGTQSLLLLALQSLVAALSVNPFRLSTRCALPACNRDFPSAQGERDAIDSVPNTGRVLSESSRRSKGWENGNGGTSLR